MASSTVAPSAFIQQHNLVEQVADYLTQAIIQQHFLPGERLSEVQLSRDLGVSRAPVREAARLLESRGLLISKPRRGFFVRALNAVELEDVFDLRLCLERHAMQRLTERYTPEAKRALEQQVDVLCEAAASNDGTRRIEEDLQFHRLMLHYADNGRLLRAFDDLTHELRLCITLITKTHEAPDTIATSHYQLLEALNSGSPDACREAIDYHIGVAREFVVKGVGETGGMPMKTFFHADQLLHQPQTYFSRGKMRTPQEVPERATHLLAAAERLGFERQAPADYGVAPLRAVHSLSYLRFLKSAHQRWHALEEDWGEEVISNIFVRTPNALRGILAEAARYLADGSAPVGQHTWQSAYWSAQSAVAGAEALLAGEHFAYALSRPPGHHAGIDSAGGFCFLNNAAIAAQHLKTRYPRIVVLDPDMHHGQGIQEIFYQRDDVMYISIHGDTTNFYPAVTGFEDERGQGAGLGYNLNLPMPHGSDESVFFDRLEQACRAIRLFEPDAIVLALGFDIYELDPQAKVAVSTAGFGELGRRVAGLNVPTLVVQEGGYYLEGLEANAVSFFEGLLGRM